MFVLCPTGNSTEDVVTLSSGQLDSGVNSGRRERVYSEKGDCSRKGGHGGMEAQLDESTAGMGNTVGMEHGRYRG